MSANGERVAFDGMVSTKNGDPYTGLQGYDADFFVVSNELAIQFSKNTFFKDVTKLHPTLTKTFKEFSNVMQKNPVLSGMKPEIPTFRVFSEMEIFRKSGTQYFFLSGGK